MTSPIAPGVQGNPFILTLSDKQQAALAQFKSLLADQDAYAPPDPASGRTASVDDLMLVRFLKARRWNPHHATEQFLSTIEWRKKHGVDLLFREEVVPEEYESWKQTYPKWTGRRDRHGNPLYVYKLSVLTSAVLRDLNKVPEEVRYRRIVALYELLHNLAFPLCLSVPIPPPVGPSDPSNPTPPPPPAPLPPNSIRLIQNTTIIDFSATSLGSMFSFRHHLAQASTLAQANHPETLGSIFVVGAPGWWSTVWGWIKNWFDEQTRAKVHIVPAGSDELFAIIPRENLPKAYGGDLEWVFEDDPSWDEDMHWLLRDVGAPEKAGQAKLIGPVTVTPRTEERPIKVALVGKGRHVVLPKPKPEEGKPESVEDKAANADAESEISMPASISTISPPPASLLDASQVAGAAEGLPVTPGGPQTPAATVAPREPSYAPTSTSEPVPATLSLNGLPPPTLKLNGNGVEPDPKEEQTLLGGFAPAPIGPGLGPLTPGTPGFVPVLTGAVVAVVGEGAGEGNGTHGVEKGVAQVTEAVAKVEVS